MALTYLVSRFFFRIADFFHHWYVGGVRKIFHSFVSLLENLDRWFAVEVTARHFFHPLYKDYSIIGRVLGVFFRSIRLILGISIYLVVGSIFVAALGIWLLVPLLLLLLALTNFSVK